MKEKYLVNVTDDVEASVLEGLLNDAGIPSRRIVPSEGQYMNLYSGYSVSGININVPEDKYDSAIKVLELWGGQMSRNSKTTPEEKEYYSKMNRKRSLMKAILVGSICVPFILLILIAMFTR